MRVTWDDLLRPGDAPDFFDRDPLPAFDAATREFSVANAWWLAELSRIVYRRDDPESASPLTPLRREFLRRAGFGELAFFRSEQTGSAALLVKSSAPVPFAALVFRGTEQEIQDFVHDADTLPIPAFGGTARVHRGFKRALNSIWTPLERALDSLNCPMFYTGHSLGAALATLAAARRAPHAVYAFGSPRVGDEKFVARLQHVAIHRIVHGTDIVTTVPPEILGFRHAGQEHRIGSATAPAPLLNAEALWSRLTTPVDVLADHAPVRYVQRLL